MSVLPAVPAPESRLWKALRRLDWWLVVAVALLMGFGLLMIMSASSLHADRMFNDPNRFVLRQALGMTLGVGMIIGILFTPYSWFRRGAWWFYGVGLIGLMLCLVPGVGHSVLGAWRWIKLGPLNIQPSEFAKISLILVLASYLAANQGRLNDFVGVVVPAFGIALPMIGLLMLEPDFGTTVITCALVFAMLFAAGIHWGWTVTLGVLGGATLSVMAVIAPYRLARIVSFWDPFGDVEQGGHQVVQGWIAMASGGWFGQGIASGVAQRGNLPEAHNDFISAVVGEELGVVGWALLVTLYILVVWRGFGIATRAKSLFGTLVASAVTVLIGSQAMINLGVVVGWMPPKGLVLPFMSYGASAMIAHLICIGLLLRVSMEANAGVNHGRGRTEVSS